MAIQEISQNQLFDQSLINAIIKDVNALNDKVTRASSKIYNTTDSTSVEAYIGSFAISTYQTTITIDKGATSASTTIAFDNNFVAAPLVFAQLTSNNASTVFRQSENAISLVTSDISATGCTVHVRVQKPPTSSSNQATLSIMAIGLTLL